MKFRILLLCFFLFSVCNAKIKVIDQDYIEFSRTETSFKIGELYYIDKIFNGLYSYDKLSTVRPPSINSIIPFIPLKSPKILGSFSNNTMFFIGSQFLENNQKNIYSNDKIFKPIYLINDQNTILHSMYFEFNYTISIISILTDNNNEGDFYSISIQSLDAKHGLQNIINLKDVKKQIFKSKIKVKYDENQFFGNSIDKTNYIYSSIVKEYGTNDSYIINFNYDTKKFESYKVKTFNLSFDSPLSFGSYLDEAMVYGKLSNGSSSLIYFNLKNDYSDIKEIKGADLSHYTRSEFPYQLSFVDQYNKYVLTCKLEKNIDLKQCLETPIDINSDRFQIGDTYLIYRNVYRWKVVDMAQFYLKLFVPLGVIFVLLVIGVPVYIFVYRKRKLQKEQNNNHVTIEKETLNKEENNLAKNSKQGADLGIDP